MTSDYPFSEEDWWGGILKLLLGEQATFAGLIGGREKYRWNAGVRTADNNFIKIYSE